MSPRYTASQKDRKLEHPSLEDAKFAPFTFAVCADTQFGMTSRNREWETEMEYSKQAIRYLNEVKPLFCCVCGDLVDMSSQLYTRDETEIPELDAIQDRQNEDFKRIWDDLDSDIALVCVCGNHDVGNRPTRATIQDRQNEDFKRIWDDLDSDIALVCVCGNHDVGNRPTRATIQRFRSAFGDDYLSFWVRGTFNIVLNTSLFMNTSGAGDLYTEQLAWLKESLQEARLKNASQIFVFGHHPWFLYDENETVTDLKGEAPYPPEWEPRGRGIPDSDFSIPIERRAPVLDLFREYNVSAAFAGHFHQNLVSRTSSGMYMIVTSSLSLVFESSGIPSTFNEPRTRGVRLVSVEENSFQHKFVSLM